MPNLEIITIGTELLLGEITDTNSTYIARTLRDHGIDIFRITTIGDNQGRIASAIQEALTRAEIVITTGGLGPTVDDPTRQAVADATDRDLVFDPDLWQEIEKRFLDYGRKPSENNRRQAYIPDGGIPIHNPVGTAPCFVVEIDKACVISLPGVPREMEYVLHESVIPFLSNKFVLNSQIIKATVLHAASIGESLLDELIDDLERLSNPTVGLLAHPGQVDIRVTAKANSEHEAIQRIQPIVEEVNRRLGEHIYGYNKETLELIITRILNHHHLKLGLVECGLEGKLSERMKLNQPDQIESKVCDQIITEDSQLESLIKNFQDKKDCDVWFAAVLNQTEKPIAFFHYQDSLYNHSITRKYGGPKDYAPLWAQNLGLDFLRKQLIKSYVNQEIGKQ